MKNHLLDYPLVNQHSYGKSPSFIGKSTIDGPFSIAMLVYQRVISSPPFYGLKDVFLISYMHHGFWVCFFRAERGIGRLMEPNGLLPKMPKMCEKSINFYWSLNFAKFLKTYPSLNWFQLKATSW